MGQSSFDSESGRPARRVSVSVLCQSSLSSPSQSDSSQSWFDSHARFAQCGFSGVFVVSLGVGGAGQARPRQDRKT